MAKDSQAGGKPAPPPKPDPPGPPGNNPGNIEYHNSIQWLGLAEKQSGRFAKFTDRLLGLRAMVINTVSDQRNNNDWTLTKLITRLSPFKENRTTAMIAHVATATGQKADKVVDLRHDPDLLFLTVQALIIEENGHQPDGTPWYTDAEIKHAIDIGLKYIEEAHPDDPPKASTPATKKWNHAAQARK